MPDARDDRPAQDRSASRRLDIKLDPVFILPALLAARAVRQAPNVDGGAAVRSRKRRSIVMDAVIALAIALMLICAWKVIALALALNP
jgi:hypothetical protein